MYPQYHNMIPLVLYLNHHYDFYRTVKIISGIITMIYSAVNHSYDSDRTIKIIPGIITMIYSAVIGSVLEHSQLQCHAKSTMSSFYKNHLIIN